MAVAIWARPRLGGLSVSETEERREAAVKAATLRLSSMTVTARHVQPAMTAFFQPVPRRQNPSTVTECHGASASRAHLQYARSQAQVGTRRCRPGRARSGPRVPRNPIRTGHAASPPA